MARIDNDADDYEDDVHPHAGDDDFDDVDRPLRTPWSRRLLTALLACTGLGLGFVVPYAVYLNHQVTTRFSQLRWQLPTRVYARPLQVQPGIAMDLATLRTELDAAAYRDDGVGDRPGTYAVKGGHVLVSSRGFNDVGGAIRAHRLDLALSDGRIVSVVDRDVRKELPAMRLDPARIATLYGAGQEERQLVSLDEVPEKLVTGLQAVEDKDFARHHGIDPSGLARALWVTLRSRGASRQGGSTLTQQLARSGLLGIGNEVNVSRKFKEILYALILETRYDKRTILETYFNQVYLGQQGAQAVHGVASAAQFWFGRPLGDLNDAQIALLIALVKGPSYYDPRRHPERALDRRNFVLGKLLENHVLSQAECDAAMKAPLGVTPAPVGTAANRFPAYVELVRRQLASDYPADALQGAGFAVMTAMSPSAQAYSEGAVKATLDRLATRGRPALESGMVVTDAHSGEVIAAIGSRDFRDQGFNRAIDARRPIGSLVKPFVYLLALAQPGRYSLATLLQDTPVRVLLGNGHYWTPQNSDNTSHGTVRLIDALALSLNQASVRLGMDVGPPRVAELLRNLAGLHTTAQPALLLGATDQTPYGVAQAYQFLASGGRVQPLRAVRGVLDVEGTAVKRYDTSARAAQAGDAIAAQLVTVALQRAVSQGTGKQLMSEGFGRLTPAGKTGTSNDSRDSWFAGWTGDHLAVIWVGNDQNKPTGLYGATGAMRVWSALFRRLPTNALQVQNAGLDWQWIARQNSTDAGCPGAQRLPFVSGFAPAYQSCAPVAPELPQTQGDDSGEPGIPDPFPDDGGDGTPVPAQPVPTQSP